MPRRRKPALARPAPIQPPLFAEAAALIRILPERDGHRYYRLEVWPDLFGRDLLICRWGRIGTPGWHRLHLDPSAAINAPAARARAVTSRDI